MSEFLIDTICLECHTGKLKPLINMLAYECDTCGQRYIGILEPVSPSIAL